MRRNLLANKKELKAKLKAKAKTGDSSLRRSLQARAERR
jgi:hypothetical protein